MPFPRRLLHVPSAWADVRTAVELVADATLWSMRFCDLIAGAGEGGHAKSDASPVTAADLALQAVMAAELRREYGAIPIVGEESTAIFRSTGGDALRASVHSLAAMARPEFGGSSGGAAIDEAIDLGSGDGRSSEHWVIDPIDGTKGFLRHQQFCVCLALIRDGVPVLGVAGCPRLGERGWLVAAVRGQGSLCWNLNALAQQPHPIEVRPSHNNTLVACESSGASDRARARLRRIGDELGATLTVRPMESQCKFVLVSAGEADLAVRLASREAADNRDMVWDYAGAVVFAEESGGRMTDCDGQALRFGRGRAIDGNRGVLCAPGWLHDAAIDACRRIDVEFGVPIGQREEKTR